jgi:mitochondrial fission protein ELM1
LTGTRAPRIWVVASDKAGDNAQVEAVVARLPWPVEYRRLYFKRPFVTGKPPFFASLYHVDKARSDRLEPPWPDVVITIGRRPAMAALWIRRQSGRRSRIVLFGRPKRQLDNFALVIVSAQFLVDAAANVLSISLPLMRADAERIARDGAAWQAHFAALSRPVIAVLVGGATRPFVFDADDAAELIRQARGYCGSDGCLYITTSRRTAPAAVAALRANLTERDHLYCWGDAENPYHGLLAHADGFVVTGDSMSMLTEVARLSRPLAIFPLRQRSRRRPGWIERLQDYLKYRVLPRVGFTAYPRDLTQIHRALYEAGAAVPAGEPFSSGVRPRDELERVVDAVAQVCRSA